MVLHQRTVLKRLSVGDSNGVSARSRHGTRLITGSVYAFDVNVTGRYRPALVAWARSTGAVCAVIRPREEKGSNWRQNREPGWARFRIKVVAEQAIDETPASVADGPCPALRIERRNSRTLLSRLFSSRFSLSVPTVRTIDHHCSIASQVV
jgi:hypothetical protein